MELCSRHVRALLRASTSCVCNSCIQRDKNVSKDIAGLLESNIDIAEDVLNCLKPLRTVTTALCTEESPTISIIMPLQHQLLKSLMAVKDSDSTVVKEMKNVIVADLSTRYTENKSFLQMAALLDPRFKNMNFLTDDKKFKRQNEIVSEAALLKGQQPLLVPKIESGSSGPTEQTLPALPALDLSVDSNVLKEETSTDLQVTDQPRKDPEEPHFQETENCQNTHHGFASIFSESDLQITFVEQKTPLEMADEEMRAYRLALCLPINMNPLTWWKEWSLKLPLLGSLVRNVLCIPATSVPSERVFSTAGDIVSAQRANLKSQHVDKLIFLKKNMK